MMWFLIESAHISSIQLPWKLFICLRGAFFYACEVDRCDIGGGHFVVSDWSRHCFYCGNSRLCSGASSTLSDIIKFISSKQIRCCAPFLDFCYHFPNQLPKLQDKSYSCIRSTAGFAFACSPHDIMPVCLNLISLYLSSLSVARFRFLSSLTRMSGFTCSHKT